jgi:hypothetical protein
MEYGGYGSTREYGTEVWEYGSMGVQEYGSTEGTRVWEYESMGIREYGGTRLREYGIENAAMH